MYADAEIDLKPLRELAACAIVGASVSGTRTIAAVGPVSAASQFRIASLTKPLTAVATVLAAREAGVGLDTPVLDVLPELLDDWAAERSVSIADVLSQTSGLASTVTADDVAALGDRATASLDSARLVVRAGSSRPPGQRWEYYNGNYFLAGAVVGALTETSYETAMERLLLAPWGLTSTSFTPPSDLTPGVDQGRQITERHYPRGRRPSGGLCSTVADLLSFGEHLLDRPDLLGALKSPRTRADDPVRYGLGWAIGPSGQMFLNGRLLGIARR